MVEVNKLINAYHGKEFELAREIEEQKKKREDLAIDEHITKYNSLLLKVPR